MMSDSRPASPRRLRRAATMSLAVAFIGVVHTMRMLIMDVWVWQSVVMSPAEIHTRTKAWDARLQGIEGVESLIAAYDRLGSDYVRHMRSSFQRLLEGHGASLLLCILLGLLSIMVLRFCGRHTSKMTSPRARRLGRTGAGLLVLLGLGMAASPLLLWVREPTNERMRRAIARGDVARVESLLRTGDRGRPLSDEEWAAVLMQAIGYGWDGSIALLVGLRPPAEDHLSGLLTAAATVRSYDTTRYLLEMGASPQVDLDDPLGRYGPLHFAIALRSKAISQLLIAHGAEVDAYNCEGYTPLLTAVTRGQGDLVRMLLEAGADPNLVSADERRVTALAVAGLQGDSAMVQLLVEHGARHEGGAVTQ